jgi:hypothetical protein
MVLPPVCTDRSKSASPLLHIIGQIRDEKNGTVKIKNKK